jgi:hypothetical protein
MQSVQGYSLLDGPRVRKVPSPGLAASVPAMHLFSLPQNAWVFLS